MSNSCYAQNGILIDLYEQAWANGTAAANATGYLRDLDMLSGYLITDDESIIAESAMTVIPDQYYEELDYFYRDLDDEYPASPTGAQAPYPIGEAPFPRGSGGSWLLGTATGNSTLSSATPSGSPPIDNGVNV